MSPAIEKYRKVHQRIQASSGVTVATFTTTLAKSMQTSCDRAKHVMCPHGLEKQPRERNYEKTTRDASFGLFKQLRKVVELARCKHMGSSLGLFRVASA